MDVRLRIVVRSALPRADRHAVPPPAAAAAAAPVTDPDAIAAPLGSRADGVHVVRDG